MSCEVCKFTTDRPCSALFLPLCEGYWQDRKGLQPLQASDGDFHTCYFFFPYIKILTIALHLNVDDLSHHPDIESIELALNFCLTRHSRVILHQKNKLFP